MPEPSFEEALDKLEKIVAELEEGNLPLEDTLRKFEEGVRLSRLCEKKLKAAQKKVSVLLRNEQGELKEAPFEESPESEEAEEGKKESRETGSLFNE